MLVIMKRIGKENYLVHGLERLLYQARCCQTGRSPWSECEDDGEVD